MPFSNSSIRRQLTTLTVLSSAVGLLLSAAALIVYAWISARGGYERDLATVAHIVADSSTGALAFGDRKATTETLGALRAKPEIQVACLYTSNGDETVFGEYAPSGARRCPPQPGSLGVYQESGMLTAVTPVELRGERVGTLRLTQTLQPLYDALRGQVAITTIIIVVSFAISLVIAGRMQGAISKPVINLAATARSVSESRDYGLRATGAGTNELGRLVTDFNHMLGQVALREREIRDARDALAAEVAEKTNANTELESTLARLRETQAQLVQSEKLASLGALVAGVAHEINTPVGVGVTAASTLRAKAVRLQQRHAVEPLKPDDIDRFIAMADEATRIILTNLERAAGLIRSFKQVAVDQSSDERRRFGLKRYIEEVLLSLGPRLRKTPHTVTLDCPEALQVDSYPGAIAQILTNLISNSLIHAFSPDKHGHIELHLREVEGHVELVYRDDGCGMPPADLARIFDPFFTTKRGSGGSGLGMHIVFNLVTQMLAGTITVKSTVGNGVEFRIMFPSRITEVGHDSTTAVRA
jgi:signal transduction histidine kinase